MTITITAFEASPDCGQGQARDMRVRWALEEVGQRYEVRLMSFEALKAQTHLSVQPFGQIPTFEDGDLILFESGAIVLHIAEHYSGLLPNHDNVRAQVKAWVFAALCTVEPPIIEREQAGYLEADEDWHERRQPMVEDRIRVRLDQLAARLGDADWLDGSFTVGDLAMVGALRRLKGTSLLHEYPTLSAYVARGEARPAFGRAFAEQRAVYLDSLKGRGR